MSCNLMYRNTHYVLKQIVVAIQAENECLAIENISSTTKWNIDTQKAYYRFPIDISRETSYEKAVKVDNTFSSIFSTIKASRRK